MKSTASTGGGHRSFRVETDGRVLIVKSRFKRKEGRRHWFTDVMRSSLSFGLFSFLFPLSGGVCRFFLRRVRARASQRQGKRSAESNEQSTRSTSGGAAVSPTLYFFSFLYVCALLFSIYLFITLRHRTATVQSHRQLSETKDF
jgi:hypothetical protein